MELIAKYHVETNLPIKKAAAAIAAEQSTGTWTAVRGADNPLRSGLYPRMGLRLRSAFPMSLQTFPNTFPWWQETYSV